MLTILITILCTVYVIGLCFGMFLCLQIEDRITFKEAMRQLAGVVFWPLTLPWALHKDSKRN